MTRLGYAAVGGSALAAGAGGAVRAVEPFGARRLGGVAVGPAVERLLFVVAVVLLAYGVYRLLVAGLLSRLSGPRADDVRNVLRLAFGAAGVAAALGVLTDQWVGVLLSFGVVGFAVTFALQQPLLSLLGWSYILVRRPYASGDRVAMGDHRGDVIEVDFLVTTLWEVGGDLVSTNQPSGRVVTVPNSVVLSTEVVNYSTLVERVWNELSVQVAFETDLAFATAVMREVADDHLGDEMARGVAAYRDRLADTDVDLAVDDRPTVNVVQRESWVELRLRYLVHPRRGTRVRNDLYREILDRFGDHPDRVAFPISRSR